MKQTRYGKLVIALTLSLMYCLASTGAYAQKGGNKILKTNETVKKAVAEAATREATHYRNPGVSYRTQRKLEQVKQQDSEKLKRKHTEIFKKASEALQANKFQGSIYQFSHFGLYGKLPKPEQDMYHCNDSVLNEKIEQRFLSYVRIESQSVDDPDPESFPMTEGQRDIATHIYNEIKQFGAKNIKVTLSEDQYIYVDIPSNIKGNVPSVLFMAHMDVTPEAPGKGIKPQVHRHYDGSPIKLGNGVTLSPDMPQGKHLKELKGKTIITADGTTLLGADDKTGCAILVTMIEEMANNPKMKHGRVMVMLSQNEDVGKAALRYDPEVFGSKPDIVIDVDGSDPQAFSVANFTAIGQSYTFKGNLEHPSHGLENQYGDALTASAYFIGSLPPSVHPSASTGTRGYIHCYSCEHPKDSTGTTIPDEYVVKVHLRYFDKAEGDTLRQYLDDAFRKTNQAYPFVKVTPGEPILQYENIAYSMPEYVPQLIQNAAIRKVITYSPTPETSDFDIRLSSILSKPHLSKEQIKELTKKGFIKPVSFSPFNERGGTTSAMLSARMPDKIPGGPCIYSGQQNGHSIYEWCCVEEMTMMVRVVQNIIEDTSKMKNK